MPSPDAPEPGSPGDDLGRRLIFVIGAPRSGTTLLTRMLHVHPDIHARAEPHLLTPLAHLGYFHHVEAAPYDPFRSAQAARALVADLPRGEQDYLDALRAYADTLYVRLLAPTGRALFLDKTPAYALILPFLIRLYPDARYVVLTRHPFAIFASYARSFFGDDWPAAHAHQPLLERYLPPIASFLRAPSRRSHHLAYEELVADPEGRLGSLCAALGLRSHPRLAGYGVRPGPGFGDPIGVDAHDRPHERSVGAWVSAVAGRPDRADLLHRMLDLVPDDDLAAWGHTRASLWQPLVDHDPGQGRRTRGSTSRWDRYRLQRKALVALRRHARRDRLGSVLRQVRFACDVLLRS